VQLLKHLLLWILLMSCLGFAQEKESELGLLLGAEFIPQTTTASGNQLSFGRSITYSADYARHLSGENTALFLEFPFAASPSHKVSSTRPNAITSLATLYVTPSLRVRVASHAPLSPWLSGGFGYGLYEGSSVFKNGVRNAQIYRSAGTAQFGGGVDLRTPLKVLFPVSIRGEVRDYYTVETPSFGVSVQRTGQHNVVVAGGLVILF
jgi:hypothetical protein